MTDNTKLSRIKRTVNRLKQGDTGSPNRPLPKLIPSDELQNHLNRMLYSGPPMPEADLRQLIYEYQVLALGGSELEGNMRGSERK